jgi:MFS transporter, UMF1 family
MQPPAAPALPRYSDEVIFAPWLTRRILWWALYDVSASGYAALVPSLFPILLTGVVLGGAAGGEAVWGVLASASLIAAGLLAPVVGAMADRSGRRITLLTAATLVCCTACMAMLTVGSGDLAAAALFFVAAQVGYTLAVALYDSFLERLSTTANAGRISGFGWAVGFCGGIGAIVAALLLTPDGSGAEAVSRIIALVGLIFLAVALPAILALRRIPELSAGRRSAPPKAGGALADVLSTIRSWRERRPLFRFLIAFYLINDVMVTVILFATIFLRDTFGVSVRGLLWLALVFHLVAVPATFAWGWAGDRIGQRSAINLTLLFWTAAILMMVFGRASWMPVAIVVTVASVLGSTQALFRAMLAGMVPRDSASEWFGFHAIAGRLSAALGPLLFGAIAAAAGSQAPALLSLLAILLAGGVLLQRVEPG